MNGLVLRAGRWGGRREPRADHLRRVACHDKAWFNGLGNHAPRRYDTVIADIGHDHTGVAEPAVMPDSGFCEDPALFLNWSRRVVKVMLFAAAEYVHTAAQQGAFADDALTNIALRPNVHAFSYGGVPVGKYRQEAD